MSGSDQQGRRGDVRVDFLLIANLVAPGSRVLDVGCENGDLLHHLWTHNQVDGRGMELRQAGVNACVARGLSVIQGDADSDLRHYPSGAFDTVILSQTLQAVHKPRQVLTEMLRIGQSAIVSFPNFGYWRVRLKLLSGGRMPVTETLDQQWYDTANIHLCTIKDFVALCRELDIRIEKRFALNHQGSLAGRLSTGALANLFAEQAVFVLGKGS